ncbi:MAG TPA: hypothetical protein VHZ99_13650 [Steroidobacteraceae bacterium]|jgi:hypothetical protein|nr:hypothetical protein [Steroidobacteraceae bacterium]
MDETEQPHTQPESDGQVKVALEVVNRIVSAVNWRELVERRPALALAAAFAGGLVLSLVAAPLLKGRPR